MTAPVTVHVTVEFERTAETVTGRMTIGGGPSRTFFGWLELIGLLHRAVEPAGDGAPEVGGAR